MEDINTYQMAKTPSKLIHFPRSYSPKTGVMTSSFWAQFCREQDLDGPPSTYCKLPWKMKWLVYWMFWYPRRSGKCVGFAFVSIVGTMVGCISGPRQTFMIQSWSNVIRAQARMRSGPRRAPGACRAPVPNDWALGPNEIVPWVQMRLGPKPQPQARPFDSFMHRNSSFYVLYSALLKSVPTSKNLGGSTQFYLFSCYATTK